MDESGTDGMTICDDDTVVVLVVVIVAWFIEALTAVELPGYGGRLLAERCGNGLDTMVCVLRFTKQVCTALDGGCGDLATVEVVQVVLAEVVAVELVVGLETALVSFEEVVAVEALMALIGLLEVLMGFVVELAIVAVVALMIELVEQVLIVVMVELVVEVAVLAMEWSVVRS